MAFARYADREGKSWLVDVQGVKQLIWSYTRSAAVLRRSKLSYENQDLGPFGTFPLTTVTVDTNYSGISDEIKQHSTPILQDFDAKLRKSGQKAFDALLAYRNDTINNNEAFREMQQDASQQTNDAINKVQGNIQGWTTAATFVRDFCADTLMVGATLLSGGTAAVALTGAATLKGGFTYQDKKMAGASNSDALGAASLEAGTDLVVGVISVGTGPVLKEAIATRSLQSGAGAAVLVVMGAGIDGTSEFAKAVIDGKSVRSGLIAAGTRAGLDVVTVGVGSALDAAFSSVKLARLSFPVTVTRSSKEVESVTKFALNSGAAIGEDKIVSTAGADHSENAAAWHVSLACTYLPQGDSDLTYVRQNAMRRAD